MPEVVLAGDRLGPKPGLAFAGGSVDAAVRGVTGAPEGCGEVDGDPFADGLAVDVVLDVVLDVLLDELLDEVEAEGPVALPGGPVSAGGEERVPVELATRGVGPPAALGWGRPCTTRGSGR